MFIRAQGPLTVAYVLLLFAGIFFINTPSITLAEETGYNALLYVWGVFYIAGSVVALAAVIARNYVKSKTALWYFETSGLALVITANCVYGYVLLRSGFFYGEYNIVALGLVVSAFTASLVARCIEVLRFIKILRTTQENLGLIQEK
jgi:hypothetical protein